MTHGNNKNGIEAGLKIKVGLTISQRTNFGIIHVVTASCLAKKAQDLENQYKVPKVSALILQEHQAFVISAIVISVAFLEATINDLFVDFADGEWKHNKSIKANLNENQINLTAKMWKELELQKKAGLDILSKYDLALLLFGKNTFKGVEPYQSAILAKQLRNSLVHAMPSTSTTYSTIEDFAIEPPEFEKKLKGKFIENPLTGPGNAFFPDKILSADCARWAFHSCLSFSDKFFKELGIKPPYDHVRKNFIPFKSS